MQKSKNPKMFIVGTAAVIFICVLTFFFVGGKNGRSEFIPESPEPVAVIESWTENTTSTIENTENSRNNPFNQPTEKQTTIQTEEPTQTEETTESAVIIYFNEPTPPKEPPPDITGTNPDEPAPAESPDHVGQPHDNPVPDSTVAGNRNNKGEVYDPVFGWVTPGKAEQKNVDSQGDPNKMVGNMG